MSRERAAAPRASGRATAPAPAPAPASLLAGRIEALLFDLDGVLIDSYAAWHEVLNRALAERGLPPVDDARMRAGWGQGIHEDSRLYFGGESLESLAATYDRLFPACLEHVTVTSGALTTVDALAARGFRLGVVTNSPRALAVGVLDMTRLLGYFGAIAGGDEVPQAKPDPALLRLGAERLGVPLDDCVFIGDTETDVEAGRRASCRTVGLGIDADLRIESLSDLLELLRR